MSFHVLFLDTCTQSQSYDHFNQQSRSETTELQITQKSNTKNFKGYASVQGGSPPLI